MYVRKEKQKANLSYLYPNQKDEPNFIIEFYRGDIMRNPYRNSDPSPSICIIRSERNEEESFHPRKHYEISLYMSRLPDVPVFTCNLTPDFGHKKAQREGWAISKSVFNFLILRDRVR